MTTKYKVIIGVLMLAASFAGGRYSVSEPNVKIVKDVKVDEDKQVDKDTHKKTTKTIVKDKDGKEVTTIVTDQDTTTHSDDHKHTDETVQEEIIQPKRGGTHISLLAGIKPFSTARPEPLYGISATTQLIGPIIIGAWALDNGTVGGSIGLSF